LPFLHEKSFELQRPFRDGWHFRVNFQAAQLRRHLIKRLQSAVENRGIAALIGVAVVKVVEKEKLFRCRLCHCESISEDREAAVRISSHDK
jgi:hypothetical protein